MRHRPLPPGSIALAVSIALVAAFAAGSPSAAEQPAAAPVAAADKPDPKFPEARTSTGGRSQPTLSERDQAAIAACEKGAAFPLDPKGKAAPVPFFELLPPDFNLAPLEALIADCARAYGTDPADDRLKLMALRTAAADYKTRLDPLVTPLRELADKGKAEASFILYALYGSPGQDGDAPHHGIERGEAIAALQHAAAAGHQSALTALLTEYRSGPLLRRDPAAAIDTARKLAALPPQGSVPGASEAEARRHGADMLTFLLLTTEGLTAAQYAEGFAKASAAPADFAYPLAVAYRFGRGVDKDPARARKLLEDELAADRWFGIAQFAQMLAEGEGGPADGKRAIRLLEDKRSFFSPGRYDTLATLLLDNHFVGPDPHAAIRWLVDSRNIDASVRAVPLLIEYGTRIDAPAPFLELLRNAAEAGEPGAAVALARLLLSDHADFRDPEAGRALALKLAAAGDTEAEYLVIATQYANLDSTGSEPYRRDDGGPSDDEIRARLKQGIEAKEADAYLLTAKFLCRGVLYPQDDKAATNGLISAANLGSVEAMVRLGDAYDDGLGTPKDPHERLHAWREAAQRGSLEARRKITSAFTFDSFDKLITLREGVSWRVALHNDDLAGGTSRLPAFAGMMDFAGLFQGGRASDAGTAALADAVLDGFRLAPSGLPEERLVPTLKAFPDEIRLGMETSLARQGFLKRPADGYFSPDARDALRAYVEAKGPLPDVEATAASAPADGLDPAVLASVRDKAFAAAKSVSNKKERTALVRQLNVLARYGDLASRWALVSNYDEADFIRNNVTAAEITRYGLDIMTGRPTGIDKPDFKFVFTVSRIGSDGAIDAFGQATLAAIRDDPRLQDPLTLGGVLEALVFAPGACDAILDAAKASAVDGLGEDGCDETTKTALIAYARTAGPSGVDATARKAAADEILALAKAGATSTAR